MTPNSMLIESMKDIVKQRGKESLRVAQKEILLLFRDDGVISEALKYFANVILRGALPVFPALISISCEAVGGKLEKVPPIGAAIILIAGAADIHDDVIDQSLTKGSNCTVLGKFGEGPAILAGDALLIQGLMRLQKECELIPKKQGEKILNLVARAAFEVSRAEALETQLRGKLDLSPDAYYEVIRHKAVVPELTMKIGAILGNGDEMVIEALGQFGRAFGIVSTIAEEFMDLLERRELQNRLKNECPPLPFLCALQDPLMKTQILSLLKDKPLSRRTFEEITSIILNSQGAQELKKEMSLLVQNEFSRLPLLANDKAREEIKILLSASFESLQGLSA
jgi:geranylgeranyl pyrophosphate synthase